MATTIADSSIGAARVQVEQVLSVDVMFFEGVPSLVGLATPLDLTMAVTLLAFDSVQGPRSAVVVKKGIEGFVATLASRNFVTRLIMSDGEGAIGKIKGDLNMLGMEVDISGAGGHVARIERKIQTVKERIRAYISHELPFTLTSLGVAMLVLFCVSRLNYQVSGVGGYTESPRVLFSGRQTNRKTDFRAGFGEYAQCTVANTDSSMDARTEDCIAMLPTGNRTGSVKMISIITGKLVTRDQFKILPMPLSVITRLNEMAAAEGRRIHQRPKMVYDVEGLRKTDGPTYLRPTVDPVAQDEQPPEHTGAYDHYGKELEFEFDPRVVSDVMFSEDYETANGVPYGTFGPATLDVGELQEFGTPVTQEYQPTVDAGLSTPPRSIPDRATHVGSGPINLGGTYYAKGVAVRTEQDTYTGTTDEKVMNITVKEALKTRGVEAMKVTKKELSQMLAKKVWTPVHVSGLTNTEKRGIIRLQMFLKEKYLPTGVFEKLKARLVAGGNQ